MHLEVSVSSLFAVNKVYSYLSIARLLTLRLLNQNVLSEMEKHCMFHQLLENCLYWLEPVELEEQ